MLPIEFLAEARRDFDEAFDWYASRSFMAARQLANAIDAALLRISRNAAQLAFIDNMHQECPVKKFPFRVIYRKEQERIVVVAIAHAKRRPSFWQGRS